MEKKVRGSVELREAKSNVPFECLGRMFLVKVRLKVETGGLTVVPEEVHALVLSKTVVGYGDETHSLNLNDKIYTSTSGERIVFEWNEKSGKKMNEKYSKNKTSLVGVDSKKPTFFIYEEYELYDQYQILGKFVESEENKVS